MVEHPPAAHAHSRPSGPAGEWLLRRTEGQRREQATAQSFLVARRWERSMAKRTWPVWLHLSPLGRSLALVWTKLRLPLLTVLELSQSPIHSCWSELVGLSRSSVHSVSLHQRQPRSVWSSLPPAFHRISICPPSARLLAAGQRGWQSWRTHRQSLGPRPSGTSECHKLCIYSDRCPRTCIADTTSQHRQQAHQCPSGRSGRVCPCVSVRVSASVSPCASPWRASPLEDPPQTLESGARQQTRGTTEGRLMRRTGVPLARGCVCVCACGCRTRQPGGGVRSLGEDQTCSCQSFWTNSRTPETTKTQPPGGTDTRRGRTPERKKATTRGQRKGAIYLATDHALRRLEQPTNC